MTMLVNEQTFADEVLTCSMPVLVHFWAPWCGLCRMIDPLMTRLKPEFEGRVKFVRINADDNLKLANTYRLKALPTIILFQNGSPLQRFDRFNNGDDVRRALDDLKISLKQQTMSLSA